MIRMIKYSIIALIMQVNNDENKLNYIQRRKWNLIISDLHVNWIQQNQHIGAANVKMRDWWKYNGSITYFSSA